jgi:hypothetical protein
LREDCPCRAVGDHLGKNLPRTNRALVKKSNRDHAGKPQEHFVRISLNGAKVIEVILDGRQAVAERREALFLLAAPSQPKSGRSAALLAFRQGNSLAEGQKRIPLKRFRCPPPPSARQEKWRKGVWRPRKTHIFDIFGGHLAEGGEENPGQ